VDVATCIHVHDALEKEFGIEVKDRAFLVSSIETAFYIVNIHHDSH
jgi:acyl carrier protein